MSSNRLLRSVFRSALRFAQSPIVKSGEPLRIDPAFFGLASEVDEKNDEGRSNAAGNEVRPRLLQTGADITQLLKRVLRTTPSSADGIDQALAGLRKLNFIKEELKKKQREESERADGGPLWQGSVDFVDIMGTPSSTTHPPPSASARALPLFILGNSFFPEGETFLHVFEPRYRAMMKDCADGDDCFGYLFADDAKGLASVGTMCKVTYRKVLDDGRQAIRIKGIGRFRVHSMLDLPPSQKPYAVALVEPDLTDTPPQDASIEAASVELEKEMWAALKYYVRLTQLFEKSLRVTQAVASNRPNTPDNNNISQADRRERFAFSVANMIQTPSNRESQLLLQTTNGLHRLQAQKALLVTASNTLAKRLVEMGLLSEERRAAIKDRCLKEGPDGDADILPPTPLSKE